MKQTINKLHLTFNIKKKLSAANCQLSMVNGQLSKRGFSMLWIIVAVAVIGVIALLAINKIGKIPPVPSMTFDRQIQELQKLSNSDEIGDIERDLDATALEGLDQELGEVDQSLEGL